MLINTGSLCATLYIGVHADSLEWEVHCLTMRLFVFPGSWLSHQWLKAHKNWKGREGVFFNIPQDNRLSWGQIRHRVCLPVAQWLGLLLLASSAALLRDSSEPGHQERSVACMDTFTKSHKHIIKIINNCSFTD